ncbi:MAG: tetratricopeptide repeat protein [Saprospiraceae bacterium]
MMQRGLWLFLLVLLFQVVDAQPSRRVLKRLADEYIAAERWFDAKEALENLEKQSSNPSDYRRTLGIVYYQTNKLDKARNYLMAIQEKERNEDPEIQYYLGAIAHSDHKFADAIQYYKNFLRLTDMDHPWRPRVKEEIRRCGYGVYHYVQKREVQVHNLGPNVNSIGDDFAPVVSPNFSSKIYFSSSREGNLGDRRDEYGLINQRSGKYCSDMFSSVADEAGRWSQASPLSYLLNSPRHEVLLDFSNDGKRMYLFKGLTLFGGEILVDTFKRIQEKTLDKAGFMSPMKPEEGDISLYFYDDNTLLFSSRRGGGYGGLDLYITRFNGTYWSLPMNLGPEINSPYDETCPFLTKNGKDIYFSSNRSDRSYGGFDILHSRFDPSSEKWSQPENMGVPINSSEDDDFFRLVGDGTRAYFSSARKTGIGNRDIYQAIFAEPNKTMADADDYESFYDIINRTAGYEAPDNLSKKETALSTEEEVFNEIYYQNIIELANSRNTAIIEKIGNYLVRNPDVSLLMMGHTDSDQNGVDGLYASMQALEKITIQLNAFGINPKRVQLKACGYNYPIVYSQIGGEDNQQAGEYNSRVVYYFLNADKKIVPVNYKRKNPPEVILDQKGAFFEEAIKDLSYKIELNISPKPYEGEFFNKVPNPTVEKSLDEDFYHATVGLYQTYSSADELRKQLVKNGLNDAKVVVYRNGFRLDEKTVNQLLEQYPDLNNYLSGIEP